ncbi:hypothetical protein OEG84_11435 [Hoeflea sp. G2-23]|uniref:Uncharacterized protein n=1 Tax=Hoeflea algicola TaxID=2983763 RepID=A0ABT3Z949_9HYPH|nr:hypothetical protein [Hoeflea algicola]MCY0148305.1 hypothetical protein [Hoeflea algicola]
MCDPITIAGIALTAGSAIANTIAQSKVQKARDSALAAERVRQNTLDQEAAALNAASQDRYQDFGAQQDERASELGQYFTDQKIENASGNAAAAAEQATPQSGSDIVVREEAKQRGKADAFAKGQGEALGNLRSFGDLLGGIGREQARDAGRIGQIGGFKRGSSNIVPLELDEANSAGDGMKLFADVLGLGGSLATSKGLGGGTKSVDPWKGLRAVGTKPASSGLLSLYG